MKMREETIFLILVGFFFFTGWAPMMIVINGVKGKMGNWGFLTPRNGSYGPLLKMVGAHFVGT